MSARKAEISQFLREHGLVVEGDESLEDLTVAYHYMRQHLGYPVHKQSISKGAEKSVVAMPK